MKKEICTFIEELARARLNDATSTPSFNQYSHNGNANSIRRNNLRLYLEQMAPRGPEALLVGEAPSYQGCRLTGIPFVSEYILLNGLVEIGLFGESRGYRKTAEFERIRKEQSATIVWETLRGRESVPLLWNAFPFHPFKAGNGQSNRTPTSAELRAGERSLAGIIRLFNIKLVVALGNKADATLTNMGIAHTKVRHPAQGGKNDFVKGINGILS